jgi:hypothetical protein
VEAIEMVGDGGAFTICKSRFGSFKLTGLPSRSGGGGDAAAMDIQLCGATTGGGDCLLQLPLLVPCVCECEDNGLVPNSSAAVDL